MTLEDRLAELELTVAELKRRAGIVPAPPHGQPPEGRTVEPEKRAYKNGDTVWDDDGWCEVNHDSPRHEKWWCLRPLPPVAKPEPSSFKECAACAAKSGTPTLCESCLHNRSVIMRLKSATETAKPEPEVPKPGVAYDMILDQPVNKPATCGSHKVTIVPRIGDDGKFMWLINPDESEMDKGYICIHVGEIEREAVVRALEEIHGQQIRIRDADGHWHSVVPVEWIESRLSELRKDQP